MLNINFQTHKIIDNTVYNLHKESIDAAKYLEAHDEEDFGKANINSTQLGVRYVTIYEGDHDTPCSLHKSTESEVTIGITTEKIKTLQRRELMNKITELKKNAPKEQFNLSRASETLITPALSSTPPEQSLKTLPKRSKNCAKYPIYDVAKAPLYLSNENVVQKEFDRLTSSNSNPGMDTAITKAAKTLMQSETERRITTENFLTAGLTATTAVIAWKYLNK
ncbi:MAG: hypothetical protein V4489_00020 [Chlamydiota bacterium]